MRIGFELLPAGSVDNHASAAAAGGVETVCAFVFVRVCVNVGGICVWTVCVWSACVHLCMWAEWVCVCVGGRVFARACVSVSIHVRVGVCIRVRAGGVFLCGSTLCDGDVICNQSCSSCALL